jgi:ribosomal protein S18 acetylase RimI-like enzyme
LGSDGAESYNVSGYHARHFMQILDLRQIPSRKLEPLFQEETSHWRDELHWDYRPSVDLIRKFVDSHSLGGYVAMEDDKPAGYAFYVLEDHKGLIGGLFVSSRKSQESITKSLIAEMVSALRATPRLKRVEAQLMPFGTELNPEFLSKYFTLHTRLFMLLPLAEARLSNKPISSGLRLEPWTDKAFESAARLIQLAYADHVDSEINDQYCSEAGGMKFLRNIVLLPGCGQFLPEASFLVQPVTGDRPIGMVLTSTVASGVGHTTQICVMPGYQGHGIGRAMMEGAIQVLKRRKYESLSLTVTSANSQAVQLYEHLGFRIIKKFAAGVWQAHPR